MAWFSWLLQICEGKFALLVGGGQAYLDAPIVVLVPLSSPGEI